MNWLIFTILFFFIFNTLKAQVAIFEADTVSIGILKMGGIGKTLKEKLESRWKIKGQTVHYFGKSIKFPVDTLSNQIDTIFYKKSQKSSWEPFLCKIYPGKYLIRYNQCCDDFNILFNPKNKTSNYNLPVQFINLDSTKKYIGVYGRSAKFLTSSADTLFEYFESAMSSNCSEIAIREIGNYSIINKDSIDFFMYSKQYTHVVELKNTNNRFENSTLGLDYQVKKEYVHFWLVKDMCKEGYEFKLIVDFKTNTSKVIYQKKD